jgi:hypothetical protein
MIVLYSCSARGQTNLSLANKHSFLKQVQLW